MKRFKLFPLLSVIFVFTLFIISLTAFADETSVFDYYINDDSTVTITGYKANDLNIVIPKEVDTYKVTAIGDNAFSGMERIEKVTIDADITSIGSSAFYGCISLAEIKIPDTVTQIGEYAFGNCPLLTADIIPDSLQNKNDKLFSYHDDTDSNTASSDIESEADNTEDNTPIIVILVIVSAFSIVACGVCVWMFVKSKRNKR
ncbi:MAG: leucine-rich repeat domain-containing protein [Ruminiclostridium sp.]|nr:leucine-rich repeat domain-containing protein [Ruminiclostridium sp.]